MKTASLLVLLCTLQAIAFSQAKDQAELKEYFTDAEYFLAQEEYADALYDYLEIYNSGFSANANINYRMGICYLNIPGQKDKAIPYLLEATKTVSLKYKESTLKQKSAPVDAYLYLGNAYRVSNQLGKAIESYEKFKTLTRSSEEMAYADQQILAAKTALGFMNSPDRLRFTNLGDSINGVSSNYKAVISGNGLVLIYMNELPFYDAIYYSTFANGAWTSPVNITPQIQSDGDQFVSSVSFDGKYLLLTREDAFNSDIYFSRFENGQWTRSQPLPGQDINTKFWESHACLSRDMKTLYFSSNRKGSLGGTDIYRSVLQPDGVWGESVNMGSDINTVLNEDTPFLSDEGNELYFSSQGHTNMGGYDVFKSTMGSDGKWSKPQNLGYPVSTTDDDLFVYPWRNGRVIYLSAIRPEGFGKEDIYAVQPEEDRLLGELLSELLAPPPPPPPVPEPEPAPVAETAAIEKPAVGEAVTEPPVDSPAGEKPSVALPDVGSEPAAVDLTPVYFAFNDFKLNEDGRRALAQIHILMQQYPSLTLRLIGHADAKGPADYNLTLSERRARTALDVLVAMGTDPGRLSAKGLGEKNFAAINSNSDGTDNPQGRQLNRRVEYELLTGDRAIVIVRLPAIPENLRYKQ